MSYESYDDRNYRSDRHRRNRPTYREEEVAEARSGPRLSRHTELVRRRSDSVEEVEREFPPGDPYVQRRNTINTTRRAHSDGRGRYEDGYYKEKRGSKRYDDRKGTRHRDYTPSSSSSESRPHPRRRKSLGEQALAALGLTGVAAAATGSHRSRSRNRRGDGDRHRGYSNPRSRSDSRDASRRIQQAVKAAIIAGAGEAFRSRNEPGGWTGDKGKRILTAAISAGGIDGILDKDPDKKGPLHTIEAVIGGLASNRIINGPRDRERSGSRSRSRPRSRSRGDGGRGLKGLAAGGLAAAAGKALLDGTRNRSKSRGRRSHSSSGDSPSPRRSKKRSKSVSEYVSKGIAALGLGEAAKEKGRHDGYRDSHRSRRDRDYEYDDDYDDGYHGRLRGGGGEGGDGVKHGDDYSSSDYISSSEDERTQKKLRGKELLTAGLASVATIHAAHSMYKSVEQRKKRSKLVKKGHMSPEESRRLKNKARFQDATAVGIAAIGVKGAVSEWKEMKEQRDERHKLAKHGHEQRLRALEAKFAASSHGAHSSNQPNSHQHTLYDNVTSGPIYQDGNPYHTESALPPPPIGPIYTSSF